MPFYKAPVEDYKFVLFDLLKVDEAKHLPGYDQLDRDTANAVLEGAAQLCEEVLQPLNRSGDEEGCIYENGVVRTPKGFKEAYRQMSEGGWNRLSAPESLGGAGLPVLISFTVSEMMFSANQAFAMYPGLTNAAMGALAATGADWMRKHIVPKMADGVWTGTMCLTEPHCGTDLKLMKTRAVEQPDGTYRMTGTKIFISGGEHDMTDNIIHMVIAKIPDETGKLQDDLSTVNFFMVPKFLVGEDGKTGARNGVSCGGIEHKMGIKGSATCVMNFDEAVAWRLGPKPEPKAANAGGEKKRSSSAGMAGMFGMMNAARMGVGIQGVAIAEVACQNAAQYARDRRAMRALTGAADPNAPADPIIVQPDVRRMLMRSRAFAEGARALAMWTTHNMSLARGGKTEEERQLAGDLSDLMTPVVKAFFTDMGFEAANDCMQVWGGHGYVRDNGMEQFVRDARINQVYEGANGVQAIDLVGRKLAAKGGRAIMSYFKLLGDYVAAEDSEAMKPYVAPLKRGIDRLSEATGWLMQNALKDPNNAGAASVDYLRIFGIVSVGYMWARMAKCAAEKLAANEGDATFLKTKLAHARFWMERMMPDTASLYERITAGAGNLMELDAAHF